MTKEELKIKLDDYDKKCRLERRLILVEYAKANSPHKEGDTVTDHIGSLLVKNITYYVSFDDASCIYYGIELNKHLTPMKKQTGRGVYQFNITKP